MTQHRRGADRGLSNSVQYALVWPVLMLATLGIIQAGVWIHGHNVAIRAANAGADAARGVDGGAGQAKSVARNLAKSGGLTKINVSVAKGPRQVRVTVNAVVPMFFDLGLSSLSETATAPVERVTQP